MLFLPLVMAADLTLRLPDQVAATLAVDRAVLAELNRARVAPAGLARDLRVERGFYRGNLLVRPGADASFITVEGVAPVDEAISFVDRQPAESSLAPSPLLDAAAADHQTDQASSGLVGHAGADGSSPSERVRRRGGDIYVGELIAYGSIDPAEVVRQLVVDDGVADRGHRRLLYDPSLRYAGVSCGAHPVYRYMCVVTLSRTPDGRADLIAAR